MMRVINIILLISILLISCNNTNTKRRGKIDNESTLKDSELLISPQNTSNNKANQDKGRDTILAKVTLIQEYEIGKNIFFPRNDKTMNSVFPQEIYYQGKELFMLNFWGELNIYNFETKKTLRLSKITSFLHHKFFKEHTGASGFNVKGDSIFVGVGSRYIYIFDRRTQDSILTFPPLEENIERFAVFNNHSIYAFNSDGLFKMKNINEKPVYVKHEFFLAQKLLMYNDTVVLTNSENIYLQLYNKNSMHLTREFKFNTTDEYVYLIGASSKQYVWINEKETGLLVYSKTKRATAFIKFDNNFLAGKRQVPMEDLSDGIRVAQKSDTEFYFLIMKNNKIKIYEVSWK